MSALGHKRTSEALMEMPALTPKADIGIAVQNVRFVPKADIIGYFGHSLPRASTHSGCSSIGSDQ